MIWGKRKVTGHITTDTTKTVLNFTDIDTGKIDLSQFGAVGQFQNGGLSASVIQMFADLGYTSEGRSTKEMITDYQIDHSIIKNSTEDGAGTYGPRTKASLSTVHAQYIILRNAELEKIEAEKALLISEKNEWEHTYNAANQKISSLGSPKKGEQGVHIRELQKTLKSTGYFKGKDTGIM